MPGTEGLRGRPRDVLGSRPPRAVDWLEAWGSWAVLGAGMALYGAFVLWVTRGTTLFVDEQKLFVGDNGFHPAALLAPFNGHLFLVERLMYAVDFKLFGASFLLPRLVEVVGVLSVVALLFVMIKRRIGAAAALAPALLLLFFGSAWENNLVPSGIATVYAVAAGLAALLLLESTGPSALTGPPPRRTRLRDACVCALLIVSVCSWTLGAAFGLGALVLILLQPGSRRRVWVAVVPLALYGAWLVWVRADYVPAHGEIQTLTGSNILLIPNYVANEASSVVGALAGLNYDFQPQTVIPAFSTSSEYGPVLAVVGVAALVLRVRRGGRSPTLWALVSILLAFWVALALGYGLGRNSSTARYVYGGGVLVLLIAAEAARGTRLSAGKLVALYLVTALALGANLARLRDGEHFYRPFATSLRARLTAVELASAHVRPTFSLEPQPSLDVLRAGPYLAAVARIGSPAYSQAELARQPENIRHDADSELVAALGIAVSPQPAGELVTGCQRLVSAPGTPLSFDVRPPGVTLRSPRSGQVALRRFASSSTVPVGALPAGQPVDLRIPADRSARTWQVGVTATASPLTVCQLGA